MTDKTNQSSTNLPIKQVVTPTPGEVITSLATGNTYTMGVWEKELEKAVSESYSVAPTFGVTN